MTRIRSLSLLLAIAGCDRQTADDACTPSAYFVDADGDGFGAGAEAGQACEAPAGFALVAGDCNDEFDIVYPGAPDECCSADFNCDGAHGVDADGDGEASEASGGEDCDDADPTVARAGSWYPDDDGDGFGRRIDSPTYSCHPASAGYTQDMYDCDDTRADVNPDAEEICHDGTDGNCDGVNYPCGASGELEDPPSEMELVWDAAGIVDFLPVGDLNGDGADDFGLGFFDAGSVGFGTASLGFGDDVLTAWGKIHDDTYGRISALQGPGDVNGDGVDDLILVGHDDSDDHDPLIWLLYGPLTATTDLDSSAPHVSHTQTYTSFGDALETRLDATGDDRADLIVSDSDIDQIWILSQPWEGTSTASASARLFGIDVEAPLMCDLDGDGLADITSPNGWAVAGPFSGNVWVPDHSATWSFSANRGLCAGDLDLDGLEDVMFAGSDTVHAVAGVDLLVDGPADPIGTMLPEDVSAVETFGTRIAAPGDLDADGHADLAIGQYTHFYIAWGPVEGTVTTADPDVWKIDEPYYKTEALPLGGMDLSGDGVPEMVAAGRGGPEREDDFLLVYVLNFAVGAF